MNRTLIVALILIACATAHADSITVTNGGPAQTLSYAVNVNGAAITGTTTFSLLNNWITIVIANTSNASNPLVQAQYPSLSGLGFNTTPTIVNDAGILKSANLSTWDVFVSSQNGNTGVGNFEVRTGDPGNCARGPANSDDLCAGEQGQISFQITKTDPNFSGTLQSLTIDNAVLHFQYAAGSSKPTGTGTTNVAEPGALSMLLLGLGGFIPGFRRRSAMRQ